jgi:hypothetical protein
MMKAMHDETPLGPGNCIISSKPHRERLSNQGIAPFWIATVYRPSSQKHMAGALSSSVSTGGDMNSWRRSRFQLGRGRAQSNVPGHLKGSS